MPAFACREFLTTATESFSAEMLLNFFKGPNKKGSKIKDTASADAVSLIFDPFLFGPLKKFRSISAEKLSVAVVKNSLQAKAGINYFDYKDFI